MAPFNIGCHVQVPRFSAISSQLLIIAKFDNCILEAATLNVQLARYFNLARVKDWATICGITGLALDSNDCPLGLL